MLEIAGSIDFTPIVQAIIKERFTPFQETDTCIKERAALFLNEEGLMKEAVETALEAGLPILALQYIKKMAPEML
ncbi:putative subunit of tRNA(5-methylaminomethyl-2-thiouridylate) methyltransferase [Halalkalibacter oceani]